MDCVELIYALAEVAFLSCVCHREIHNYTVMPGDNLRDPRLLPKACCRCPEDCLCHGGGPGK